MKNKEIAIKGFYIGFSIVCIIWSILSMIIIKNLCEKVSIQEQEINRLLTEVK